MSRQRKIRTTPTPRVEPPDPGSSFSEPDRDDERRPTFRPDPTVPGDYEGPPLHGKTDPPEEMADTKPTLDDEQRSYHHHPSESGAIEFTFEPLAGDAAADLAGDFGSQFLEGATRGEDLSERVFELDEEAEPSLSMLLDEAFREGEGDESETLEEPEPPPPPPRSDRQRKVK